jgi:hypothetical protein
LNGSKTLLNVTFPTFIFGSLIAWLIGSTVHLIAGGKLIRLIFSMVFAWIGFWVGNYLGNRFGLAFFNYGQINYGIAIAISILLALFGYWLSGENRESSE